VASEELTAEHAAKALDQLIAAARLLSARLADNTHLGPRPLAASAIRR
jgi:hypothetical protein